MWCELRCTARRGRSLLMRRSRARTRYLRASLGSMWLMALLLLAFLADDRLGFVLHALALVGFRRPEAADLGGDLPDLLLVGTGDRDRGRLLGLHRDPGRDRIFDLVRVAQLQHE